MGGMKNRRGVTMVVVGVALVALVGIMAFAIDFGRMYLFRAQVHVSSDAAALAGAERLMGKDYAGPAATAVTYGQANLVENTTPTITNADIEPGVWTFPNGPFTPAPSGNWSAESNNAVQATSRYLASYRFGRIFGFTTRVRSATSVAALGSVKWTTCVKPFALPYQSLINMLNMTAPIPSPLYTTAHVLNDGDVTKMSTWTSAQSVSFTYNQPATLPTQFDAVKLPDATGGSYNGGAWDNLIAALCSDPLMLDQKVGPGSILQQDDGYSLGALGGGLKGWCSMTGTKQGGNQDVTCLPPPPPNGPFAMKVALVDPAVNDTYQVRYMSAFQMTGYDKSSKLLSGFFTVRPSSGAFSSAPGPVKRIALVQ